MENFNKEDLEKLQRLSKITCSQEEEEKLLGHLQSILQHIATLQTAQTEGVIGRHNLLECESNIMEEDMAKPHLSKEEFLKNSSDHVGGMVKVPPIIEFD